MEISSYFIISLFIFFQSIFGIGLLVFGTPTLIYFYSYNFEETLSILLPISCLISFYQTFYYNDDIKNFNYNLIKFSLPSLIFFMFFVLYFFNFNILKLLIPIVLVSVSLITLLDIETILDKIITKKNSSIILFIIGSLHGMSNLGGGIVSIYSSRIFNDYRLIRKSISSCYLIFGITQICILIINAKFVFEYYIFYLILACIPILYLSKIFFNKFNTLIFKKILNICIFIYGNILLLIYLIEIS